MAFSFGGNAPKPSGFGTPFGATTTTANTGFGNFSSTFSSTPQQQQQQQQQQASGSFGSSFGSSATGTSSFGSTFGAPSSSALSFGQGFGSQAPASAPAFGAGFGAPVSTAAPTFGSAGGGLFGAPAQQKPSLFGTPASSASLFSGSGTSAPNLFGTSSAAQASSLFGGAPASAAPGLFGTTTTAPSLFGSTFGGTAASGQGLFGGTSTATPGFGLFGGTTTTAAPSLFGGFGAGQAAPGGAWGGTAAGTGLFGPRAPTAVPGQTAMAPQNQHQLVRDSIYSIAIFNDERDDILKKWNLLQASWGIGKGYFNPSLPPVEYTVHNQYYRFKAVGYNIIPEHDNAEGLVKLVFNRKYGDLSNQRQVLVNGIGGILGNKPTLKVIIQHIKAVSDSQTEVRFTVLEKGVTGNSRTIPATDLAAFLNQPMNKQQLANVGVTSIVAYVTPSKAVLEEYLRSVPLGFDAQMWRAAVADNPNLNKYMPVPIYGFSDLKARKLRQEHETGLHKAFQEKINNELAELKKKHAASIARINELKHRFLQLQHRTLRILVRQESIRKFGIAIQPEEEYLKSKLETLYTHLNVPTQFKGQLNELISTVKLMENTTKPAQPHYKLVPESQGELKEFLQLQQNGIAKLVDIIKEDMRSLNIVTEGMKQIIQNKNVLS